jgi:hypothetical protein
MCSGYCDDDRQSGGRHDETEEKELGRTGAQVGQQLPLVGLKREGV